MKVGNMNIKPNDLLADVPPMTFTDARNAILQVANFLQGLVIIYQMSSKAAATEVEVKDMEGKKQELSDAVDALTQEIETKKQEVLTVQNRDVAGFNTRIEELKAEVAGLYDKIKGKQTEYQQADQQLQEKLASISLTVKQHEDEAETIKATLTSQVAELQGQVDTLQKKKDAILSEFSH